MEEVGARRQRRWALHVKCLSAKGFEREASNLYRATVDLIEKSDFREYYNPLTGEGYGAKNFTWSGLVVDMDGPNGA